MQFSVFQLDFDASMPIRVVLPFQDLIKIIFVQDNCIILFNKIGFMGILVFYEINIRKTTLKKGHFS